jgi:hypothetical protein
VLPATPETGFATVLLLKIGMDNKKHFPGRAAVAALFSLTTGEQQ